MKLGTLIVAGTLAGVVLIGGFMWLYPKYSVYQAEMAGKAELAKAEYAKKAQIADAEAKLESSRYLAKAAEEIQSSLTPTYLEYLRIQMMEEVGARNERTVYFTDGSPVIAPQIDR